VRAANYPSPTFDGYFAAAKATPGWRTYALPSGHDVMVDMPDRLAEVLLELA